jgi:hypothetical protein
LWGSDPLRVTKRPRPKLVSFHWDYGVISSKRKEIKMEIYIDINMYSWILISMDALGGEVL